jgi:hypothetical protein
MIVIRRVICSSSGVQGGNWFECRSESVVLLTPETATAVFHGNPTS